MEILLLFGNITCSGTSYKLYLLSFVPDHAITPYATINTSVGGSTEIMQTGWYYWEYYKMRVLR